MAFNETELAIIKTGKESGKSRQQVEEALQNYRLGITPSKKERVQNQFVDGRKSPLRALGDVSLGAVKGLTETAIALPRALQAGGQAVHAGLDPTRTFAEVREQTGLASLQGDDAAFIDDLLKAKNPEQRAGKIIAFAGELLAGGGASLLKKGFQKGTEAVGGVVGRGKTAISEALPSGLKQTVSEFGERIPRLGGRVRERVEQASVRAERIRNATPATQKAIKSGVDDRIIDFVDDVKLNAPDTLSDYKEIVDLAENVGARGAARPEFIAGQRAAEQYKLADKARKDVGGKIGEAVDALSKKQGAVNILPAQRNLRILLSQNGIQPTKGGKLVFEATEYTPAQQKKIQELYDIATKSENFTARQIWGFDKQFSQLQRTARFDSEIGDIFIKTADGGDTSIFKAFRDVYSGELENIAPEIRVLNREYAQWRTLIDDVESSIVKRGNFSGTSKVDPAEFAQTNLRRIFSDATSAADYRAIYNNLDEASRTLGYTGSRADDLAWFATRMRQIFPETVPETSATKILGGGVKQTTEKVLEAGKPSLVDQQRAIKEMIEEALGQGSFKQGGIPTKLSSLATEARKYKTADEFVDSQKALYRGSKTDELAINNIGELDFSVNKSVAQRFAEKSKGGVVSERFLSPQAKVLDPSKLTAEQKNGILEYTKLRNKTQLDSDDILDYAKDNGYDAVDFTKKSRLGDSVMEEITVLNPDMVKTKSQLTDIWNKANK